MIRIYLVAANFRDPYDDLERNITVFMIDCTFLKWIIVKGSFMKLWSDKLLSTIIFIAGDNFMSLSFPPEVPPATRVSASDLASLKSDSKVGDRQSTQSYDIGLG